MLHLHSAIAQKISKIPFEQIPLYALNKHQQTSKPRNYLQIKRTTNLAILLQNSTVFHSIVTM